MIKQGTPGYVNSLAVVGNTVYVVGGFSEVIVNQADLPLYRPLAAFDIDTNTWDNSGFTTVYVSNALTPPVLFSNLCSFLFSRSFSEVYTDGTNVYYINSAGEGSVLDVPNNLTILGCFPELRFFTFLSKKKKKKKERGRQRCQIRRQRERVDDRQRGLLVPWRPGQLGHLHRRGPVCCRQLRRAGIYLQHLVKRCRAFLGEQHVCIDWRRC